MLDPVHNQGLRLGLGTFCTSPMKSLLAEANEPCLSLRRQQLGIQYALKIKSCTNNPVFDCIYNPDLITLQTFTNTKAQKPFCMRVREDLISYKILQDEVIEFSFPKTAPWILEEPKIDLSLTKHIKAHTSSRTYQKFFKEISQKHPNRTHIFTDGSKDLASVGAAAYSSAAASQRKINGSASIFTAEAIALEMALQIVKKSSKTSFLVFSDSLSALKALKSCKTNNMSVLRLLEEINSLHPDKDIIFVWIPGHVGIEGNDQADHLAKEAATFEPPPIFAPIPSDYKQNIKRGIFDFRKNNWGIQDTKLN